MLLGAEDAPKESNGAGPVYIFGGFAGAGDGTGCKIKAVLLTSNGGFGFDEFVPP